jgi:hypothetical protein
MRPQRLRIIVVGYDHGHEHATLYVQERKRQGVVFAEPCFPGNTSIAVNMVLAYLSQSKISPERGRTHNTPRRDVTDSIVEFH